MSVKVTLGSSVAGALFSRTVQAEGTPTYIAGTAGPDMITDVQSGRLLLNPSSPLVPVLGLGSTLYAITGFTQAHDATRRYKNLGKLDGEGKCLEIAKGVRSLIQGTAGVVALPLRSCTIASAVSPSPLMGRVTNKLGQTFNGLYFGFFIVGFFTSLYNLAKGLYWRGQLSDPFLAEKFCKPAGDPESAEWKKANASRKQELGRVFGKQGIEAYENGVPLTVEEAKNALFGKRTISFSISGRQVNLPCYGGTLARHAWLTLIFTLGIALSLVGYLVKAASVVATGVAGVIMGFMWLVIDAPSLKEWLESGEVGKWDKIMAQITLVLALISIIILSGLTFGLGLPLLPYFFSLLLEGSWIGVGAAVLRKINQSTDHSKGRP